MCLIFFNQRHVMCILMYFIMCISCIVCMTILFYVSCVSWQNDCYYDYKYFNYNIFICSVKAKRWRYSWTIIRIKQNLNFDIFIHSKLIFSYVQNVIFIFNNKYISNFIINSWHVMFLMLLISCIYVNTPCMELEAWIQGYS